MADVIFLKTRTGRFVKWRAFAPARARWPAGERRNDHRDVPGGAGGPPRDRGAAHQGVASAVVGIACMWSPGAVALPAGGHAHRGGLCEHGRILAAPIRLLGDWDGPHRPPVPRPDRLGAAPRRVGRRGFVDPPAPPGTRSSVAARGEDPPSVRRSQRGELMAPSWEDKRLMTMLAVFVLGTLSHEGSRP